MQADFQKPFKTCSSVTPRRTECPWAWSRQPVSMEAIRPSGPCLMVLWTIYPDQAPALRTFLGERLRDVARPVDVLPLAKAEHLDVDGNVRDEPRLARAISDLAAGWARPEGALFRWLTHGAKLTIRRRMRWSRTSARPGGSTPVGPWSLKTDVPARH